MSKTKVSLVLVTHTGGVLCGVYQNNQLIKSQINTLKTLDALVDIWVSVKQCYEVEEICYARGPGSLSALKLLHIFIQTLHVISGIKIFAVDSFYFNQGKSIKAFGNQYFVKNTQGEIILHQDLLQESENKFTLPSVINKEDFSQPTQPLYIVPPV
ncbi:MULTISPECIES: hypothetical protein [unclassified Helicobacter]|uniref:hypothetical protein n=1 Tax=unclassified Helicobacter TaxID=2593540 RepID=UPI000CF146F4|nr:MULTISPECIES: hypothetical protein [unclassified Helicobacter]